MSTTEIVKSEQMGAVLTKDGTAFQVWAPNAEKVSVIGSFNKWDSNANPLEPIGDGQWAGLVPKAKAGDEYLYSIVTGENELKRIDPYAKQVTNSCGNGVIFDSEFDWTDDQYQLPPANQLVIYELHLGTFKDSTGDGPGSFADALTRLPYLKKLGINCIELLPIAEFPGDRSWGYNPSHLFAVESSYGGPNAFKKFVKACHKAGIGVILDVVYNHMGPGDLDMWQFDGWTMAPDKGGIYFYNDDRSKTPWGDTRPDYGRSEVRKILRDNANMWLDEFRVDGLRYDATAYIRTIDLQTELPDGWSLFQGINGEIRARYPGKLLIAEDLQDSELITRDVAHGGAGFTAQWSAHFVHPVRAAVQAQEDAQRSMNEVASAITQSFNNDPFQRVIYSESHDEVANGKQRVVSEISPDDPQNWFARKRSTLAAGLVLTSPGIPMLFQGQEFLESGWFEDTIPVDWDLKDDYRGIVRLYHDLIELRLNKTGISGGLLGPNVQIIRADESGNVLAFHRFGVGGPGDEVVVIANLSNQNLDNLKMGFPTSGHWIVRINSDDKRYSSDYNSKAGQIVETAESECDDLAYSAEVSIPAYSFIVLSQDQLNP